MDKAEGKLRTEPPGFAKVYRAEKIHAVFSFLQRIQGQRGMMLGRLLLIVKACFFFLQVAGVRQDYRAQIDGGGCGVDPSFETLAGQPRDPATVVKMSVRQDHGVNFVRRNRSIFPVAFTPFLGSLKQAAVDEHLQSLFAGGIVARVDEVF